MSKRQVSKRVIIGGAMLFSVIALVALSARASGSDFTMFRDDPHGNGGLGDALESVVFGCDVRFNPGTPENPARECPVGQDAQLLTVTTIVSGFGIEGTLTAARPPLTACVPAGSSVVTRDSCARAKAAVPTEGCTVVLNHDDGVDDPTTGRWEFDTTLSLFCHGNRDALVNTADRALRVAFGVADHGH
jgi:hypothetical protein